MNGQEHWCLGADETFRQTHTHVGYTVHALTADVTRWAGGRFWHKREDRTTQKLQLVIMLAAPALLT